jgi:hypothetical protein
MLDVLAEILVKVGWGILLELLEDVLGGSSPKHLCTIVFQSQYDMYLQFHWLSNSFGGS